MSKIFAQYACQTSCTLWNYLHSLWLWSELQVPRHPCERLLSSFTAMLSVIFLLFKILSELWLLDLIALEQSPQSAATDPSANLVYGWHPVWHGLQCWPCVNQPCEISNVCYSQMDWLCGILKFPQTCSSFQWPHKLYRFCARPKHGESTKNIPFGQRGN